MSDLRVVLWNVEWKRPSSSAGRKIRTIIDDQEPSLICLTESHLDFFGREGHLISSDENFGYSTSDGRRKVLLWSRSPWRSVDQIGSPALPGGRYVCGETDTPAGPMRVIGVCIPWAHAHVKTGRKDRAPWEDHAQYLSALGPILHRAVTDTDLPTILLGDFNQRLPKRSQPEHVHRLMMLALQDGFNVATQGVIPTVNEYAIDHLAYTRQLSCGNVQGLPAIVDGQRLSDHFGLVIDLRRTAT